MQVYPGPDDDDVEAGGGILIVQGQDANDRLVGGGLHMSVLGEDGDDEVSNVAGSRDSSLGGGPGRDRLTAAPDSSSNWLRERWP